MGQKKAKARESARKIIESGRQEFAQYGLAGARVDRIANRAGINKAMIYYHFRSKENLYQEVINEHLTQIGNFLEQNLSQAQVPEIFLFELAQFYDRMFADRQDFLPIFLRELAAGGNRIKRAFAEMMSKRGINVKLKQIIEKGKRRGEFRNIDGVHAIVSFIGMNLFYLIASPVIDSVWEIKDEKKFRQKRQKEVVDLFLYGLKQR